MSTHWSKVAKAQKVEIDRLGGLCRKQQSRIVALENAALAVINHHQDRPPASMGRLPPHIVDPLRQAVLSGMKEDSDETAVSGDWLLRAGFTQSDDSFWIREGPCVTVRFHENYAPSLMVDGYGVEWNGTRDWIWRLCEALSIPLQIPF